MRNTLLDEDKRVPRNETEPTKQQMMAVIEMVKVIAELIRDLGQVPSGHLFAELQTSIPGLTLPTYELLLRQLTAAKLIRRQYHLIKWIGPKVTA